MRIPCNLRFMMAPSYSNERPVHFLLYHKFPLLSIASPKDSRAAAFTFLYWRGRALALGGSQRPSRLQSIYPPPRTWQNPHKKQPPGFAASYGGRIWGLKGMGNYVRSPDPRWSEAWPSGPGSGRLPAGVCRPRSPQRSPLPFLCFTVINFSKSS